MSQFADDFRNLLTRHGISHPAFAHNAEPFNPDKPRVLYSGPVFDEAELVAATVALCQGKWSVNGEYVHRFEREFSKVVNQAETVAVNSGSSADLLMLAAAKKRYGWNAGDGVLVSPCGFPTSISAITLNNLTPVFVDIEWDTLNAENDAIESAIVRNLNAQPTSEWGWEGRDIPPLVRAILVSPVLGNPPDIDRLTTLAAKYKVTLFLDGCDSLGSTWNGRQLPEYFSASTCSFYPAHHISTLNGGAISSNDTELIAIARSMAQWGRACWCVGAANMCLPNGMCGKRFSQWLPGVDCNLDHRYVYDNVGWNVQQLDICAAMGLEQLKKLDRIHVSRDIAFTRLLDLFADYLPAAKPVAVHDAALPSWFGFPVILDDPSLKARLVAHLESRGIQTRSYFAGNLLAHEAYSHLGDAADYPNANQVLCRVFWLGTSPSYTHEHFSHIEKALKEFTQ